MSGTITADKILGPTAQNVSPNDFDALVKALVTKNWPLGEVVQIFSDERECRVFRCSHHEARTAYQTAGTACP